MLLHSLEINNYRSLEQVKLDNLQQFNVLIGRNNAGKSSVFQALYDLNRAYDRRDTATGVVFGNTSISVDVLTDHDNKRVLEIHLGFKLSQQERQEFVALLVAGGFDALRRAATLDSPFLRKMRCSFKAVPGNPSPIHLREIGILAEDGKWATVVSMTGDEQSVDPIQNYILINTLIERTVPNLLSASVFTETSYRANNNVRYHQIFTESWAQDPAIRWLLTHIGTYLSEAFFFNPFRHSIAALIVQQTSELVQDGANLAQVLHALKTSEEEVFEEIEHFIHGALPEIGRLRTPLINNNSTNIVFRHAQQRYSTPLTSMGGGIEQLLMIATVLLMPRTQKHTLFLEEPESHLHAGAQRYLIEQLYKGDRQVFISTHSPTFVNITRPHSLYQVMNTEGRTTITRRDAASLDRVLEDIGVRNSDVLLSDAILFVEGPGDRDVLTVFSDTLHMSFDEDNINVLPMGGGRHAERGAPIRSDLLKEISGKAPVPHLFILDRDERRKEEIRNLETRLGNTVHVFQARELENYLLIPRAILCALKAKYRNNQPVLDTLVDVTEEHIDQLIHTTADSMYSTVLIKRIRNEIGGLRDGLLPTDAVASLRSQTESPKLATSVSQEIQTRFSQHITDLHIDRIVASEKADLDELWTDSEKRLQLAPGEEILAAIYSAFGGEYSKPEDTKRIANEMQSDEICQEIRDVISKARRLTTTYS